jgi:hypothetical protein
LADVLAKVSIIKTLYATPLYDVFSMANHVIKIEGFDYMLRYGDKEVVNRVRSGHGIRVNKIGKEIDFYSFATKYCSFHNPNVYPIYDNLVVDLLLALNQHYGWNAKRYKSELLNYSVYVNIIDKCLQSLVLTNISYKMADKGFWVFAKYQALLRSSVMSKNDQILFNEVQKVLKDEAE